jgi:salicylate hydroxylase
MELDTCKPIAELGNGEKHYGDLVIIADGVWSTLRSKVLGRTLHPQPTGDIAYRITIDRKNVQGQALMEMMNTPQIRLWVEPNLYAVGHSVRGCEQFSLLLLLPDNLLQVDSSMAASMEELRKFGEGRDPMYVDDS